MALEKCGGATNQQGRELKEHGTALFPAACYDDDFAEGAVPWHWHDELEALVVISGSAVVCADSRSCTVPAGQGAFINAGAVHSVRDADSGCRLHSVVFHPRLVGGGIDSIFWQGYLQPLLSDPVCRCVCLDCTAPWSREAVKEILDAWQSLASEPPGFEFQARAALSRLVYLLTCHRPPAPKPPSEKALRHGRRIKAMLQYIQEHYAEELNTAQIAESAAVSESECLRCFHKMIGTTPIRYVRQHRIQRAAALLKDTNQRIGDVGLLCGFQETSYFAKAFREIKGCTPSEYRKKSKE